MKKPRIRPLALAVFLHEGHLFVSQGTDRVTQTTFYRPLGGGIEFGECGHEAVRRELLEEINQPLDQVRYVGMCENIFTYEGTAMHEIVLLYACTFQDAAMLELSRVIAQEVDGNPHFRALWLPLQTVRSGTVTLYPEGLLALLDAD